MAELKTKSNDKDVIEFLNEIKDEQMRKDSFTLLEILTKISKEKPKMWGDSIVGFGKYHYKYESGRKGDWFLTGFSPRKQNLVIYIMSGFTESEALMKVLGKYKTGSSCLYIKKLSDIDVDVLKKLVVESIGILRKRYK